MYPLTQACTVQASAAFGTIRWKERASSQSRKHVFHPDEFLRFTGPQGKVHPGARACGFRYIRTHTHTRTQPTVSIDIKISEDPRQSKSITDFYVADRV